MSSEDMQNNPSSFDERSFSNQRVAAAESINVSIESSDNVPIEICTDMMPVECSDKMPIQCSEPPQEMTQPPIELVIEEVPQNSESVNLEGNSAQASRASNPIVPVFHLSQSIHDDNRLHQFTERLDTFSCWSSPQRREDMALAGFYYTGCGDRVRCAFCNLQLQEWNIDVEPFSRHMHENPRCPFIEKVRRWANTEKVVINMGVVHFFIVKQNAWVLNTLLHDLQLLNFDIVTINTHTGGGGGCILCGFKL